MTTTQTKQLFLFFGFFFLFLYPLPDFFGISFLNSIKAQDTLTYTSDQTLMDIGQHVLFYKDPSNTLNLEQIQNLPDSAFQKSASPILHLGNTTASTWVKIVLKNKTDVPLFLAVQTNAINELDAFIYDETDKLTTKQSGNDRPFVQRDLNRSNNIINIGLSPKMVYVRVKSKFPLHIPLVLGRLEYIADDYQIRDLINGFVSGILVAIALYNLFLFFSVKDRLYLYYFIYIFTSLWVITHLNSIAWLIWNKNAFLFRLVGIPYVLLSAWWFTIRFLNVDKDMPRIYAAIKMLCILIACVILLELLDLQIPRAKFQQFLTPISAFSMLGLGIYSHFQGNKSARYYVVAWTFLIMGAIITSFSFSGLIPFNGFTFSAVLYGACIESILLAFALANRINIYRAESAQAQTLAMHHLAENEQLVREQNKVLEEKVTERTEDLQNTLTQLQNTESQLVQSEKMAVLGELTAGIAHEINNPVNFISSSIVPLKRNLAAIEQLVVQYRSLTPTNFEEKMKEIKAFEAEMDYDYTTEEIDLLTNSINDGATRTAQIVKGLRNFSRIDGGEKTKVSVNEGLESTLLLMQSAFKRKDIQLVKDLSDLPDIYCFAGQLNQVFMNILTNAVQAMTEKGTIKVKSFVDKPTNTVKISIADTGKGMTEDVKSKIFQPFFTTKKVGEGTGLGLSISYGIIKKHDGQIEVESTVGKGTIFTITLPIGVKIMTDELA
jgi:signal transduction histidine kinase